ncbi:MAG: lipopolysaccharide transport periplasmic protein LptA [Casimicrobiaceae bacterium]
MNPLHRAARPAAHPVITCAAWVMAGLMTIGHMTDAQAERADRRQKVVITGLDFNGDAAQGAYRLRTNVVITQGTLRITADQAEVKTRADEHFSAVLTAKPVCFRERTEKGDWAQGVADRVEYDSKDGVVELFGNAILFVGEDEIRANYITYSTQSGIFEGRESKSPVATSSGANGQRGVTFIFQPRESAPAGGAPGAEGQTPAKPAPVKQAQPPKRNEPAFSRCA